MDREAAQAESGANAALFQTDDFSGLPYKAVKDSVFKRLFTDPEYLLQLYQTLHPEDTKTVAEDLSIVTLETVIVKDIRNDLGFAVGSRLLILAEAQSTWSVNIILRSLFYLARTYQNYLRKTKQNLYNSKAVKVPQAELYVIYTGTSKVEKTELYLSEEFFGGKPSALEVKVKVIVEKDSRDIINQYILFSKIIDGQMKLHGRTPLAVQEAIRICKSRDILKAFLEQHEKEAVDVMVELYTQKDAVTEWGECKFEEGREEGREEGLEKGMVKGREEGAKQTAQRLHAQGWRDSDIASLLDYSTEDVRKWLEAKLA
ncbi:MAG: hypothetical protein LUD69_03290 [Oscillospiraceae bacterium]|nr:hypothetical protein [Oscillospiraceae bacterium]